MLEVAFFLQCRHWPAAHSCSRAQSFLGRPPGLESPRPGRPDGCLGGGMSDFVCCTCLFRVLGPTVGPGVASAGGSGSMACAGARAAGIAAWVKAEIIFTGWGFFRIKGLIKVYSLLALPLE